MSTLTRILATVLFATLTVGPVSAATARHGANLVAQGTATGTVQGTALTMEGAPIANARISLAGPQSYTTTTNASGAFTISDVVPGVYRLTATHAGFETASNEIAVVAGATESVSVAMPAATFTSLRTIAQVSVRGRGAFNTSTAAVNTLSSADFQEQGQFSVNHTLDQIPGLQISYPTSSANAASAGSIVVPNIRGGLSYETASLIDGHPLAVVDYGDYVTTFLNSFMFSSVEVIKGPGAMSPETNYAIGGTLNFHTKDPTLTPTPDYTFGYINDGGVYWNFGISDTILNGRLGFVVDTAGVSDPGLLHNATTYFSANNANGVIGWNGATGNVAGYNDSRGYIGTTETAPYNQQGLIACCYTFNGYFNQYVNLLKLQYHFSETTRLTVSYLDSETYADQAANTASTLQPTIFAPASGHGYTGSLAPGAQIWATAGGLYEVTAHETNSEPITQAEISSSIGNNTILARYYHANVNRLIDSGNQSPFVPEIQSYTYYGVNHEGLNYSTYNGVTEPTAFFDYFRQFELDRLDGYSFEFVHPYGAGDELTLSAESTNYQTNGVGYLAGCGPKYNAAGQFTGLGSPCGTANDPYPGLGAPATTVPGGSSQIMNTYMLRNIWNINPKLQGIVALYENTYHNTYANKCIFTAGWYGQTGSNLGLPGAACSPYGSNVLFTTSNQSHLDERAALEYRPQPNLAFRLSAGSSIAPEYLYLLTKPTGYPSCFACSQVTINYNNPNLVPETSFGYDFGSSYRFADGDTFASVDFYLTNLFNHFIGGLNYSGTNCTSAAFPGSGCPVAGVPLFYSEFENLANARFEGVELVIKHVPTYGFGFNLQGSLEHAYAYNIPANFYCSFTSTVAHPCIPANYNTNLSIIPGANFTGNGYFGGSFQCGTYAGAPNPKYHNPTFPYACFDSPNGLSNTNIPYMTANAEVNWTGHSGMRVLYGETLLGNNNSFNAPAFWIAYASVRVPLSNKLSIQLSGDNLFNALPGLFEFVGTGVNYPLANGQTAASIENSLGPAVYHLELTRTFTGP